MKIAFVMDPLEGVKAHKDTTYFLMLAAAERGHEVFYLDQGDLSCRHDRVYAILTPVEVHADEAVPFTIGERAARALSEMDAVMVRPDPPFDRRYLYTTLLLDLLPPQTVVVNSPAGLRNWNEKLVALHYPALTPTSLVTRSREEILDFMAQHGRVTLKPIDGFGGRGVVFIEPGGANVDQLIALITHDGTRQVIVQVYVPEAKQGDKRVLLLNGEPLGAVLRRAPAGKELNNLDAGGTAHPAELTERDREIAAILAPGMREQGILFAGIDLLGDKLIEINVTSPTVLRELSRFSGKPHNHDVIAAVEDRVEATRR